MRLLLLSVLLVQQAAAQSLPPLIPFRSGNSWGYCDSNKTVRIKPVFSEAELFRGGRAVVALRNNGKLVYCLIDEAGNYIIPPAYHWNREMHINRQYASLNGANDEGLLGLIDTGGHIVIPFAYGSARTANDWGMNKDVFHSLPGYSHWLMQVVQNGKLGLIDTNGQILLPFRYDAITEPDKKDTLRGWIVKQDDNWGLLRPDGSSWLTGAYESILPDYAHGWIAARKQGKMGVIDTQGHILIPFAYDSVALPNPWDHEVNGCATLLHDSWGWYNIHTRNEVKPAYAAPPYGTGKYVVATRFINNSNKNLLLDAYGKVLVPALYDRIVIYPDSIIAHNYMELKPGSGDWDSYSGRIDSRTFKVEQWERGCSDCKEVMAVEPLETAIYAEDRYMEYKGQQVRSFKQDGLNWKVYAYVNDTISPFNAKGTNVVYAVMAVKEKDSLYAVVDKQGRFLTQPQKDYVITGGDIPRGMLYVRNRQDQYFVTDLQFKRSGNILPRSITQSFSLKNKSYYIGYWRSGRLPEHFTVRDLNHCFRCACQTLLDHKGNIASGFESYCNVRFLTLRNEPADMPQDGLLLVTDSLGREGIVDMQGKTLYPAFSFKSRDIYFMGANTVFYRDITSGLSKITDTKASPLLGNLKIAHISLASVRPFYDRYANAETIPHLYAIYYYHPGSEAMHVVYADEHGTLYGSDLE